MVAGVGISMSLPGRAELGRRRPSPPEAIGKASGTNSTMRELGGVLGIALGVAAFSGAASYASPATFSDGFVAAMGVAAGLSLLAAAAGAALPRRARGRAAVPLAPAYETEAGR